MAIHKDENELDEKGRKTTHKSQAGMHPGMAAAIGAVVGAAGGAAVAMAYKNPTVQKKAKEQFDVLSKKATETWNKINEQTDGKQLSSQAREKMSDLRDTASGFMDNGRSESKKSKTDLK